MRTAIALCALVAATFIHTGLLYAHHRRLESIERWHRRRGQYLS